jgi:hypothetical protein
METKNGKSMVDISAYIKYKIQEKRKIRLRLKYFEIHFKDFNLKETDNSSAVHCTYLFRKFLPIFHL